MIIRKNIRPEFFERLLSGEKTFELRLADFKPKVGDTLVLKEYDPKKKAYTGRKVERSCKSVMKVNPLEFYEADDIKKHGLYVIGL